MYMANLNEMSQISNIWETQGTNTSTKKTDCTKLTENIVQNGYENNWSLFRFIKYTLIKVRQNSKRI